MHIHVNKLDEIAVVTLDRGKVNALNPEVVSELQECFSLLEAGADTRAIVLTGEGPFFTFGFDIPEFLGYSRTKFKEYLLSFTHLYTYLFLYPKPVVAALNGHTVAGGFMLATACDFRIMASGKARISLNEITFGSTVFAGSVELLQYCTGARNAEKIALSGAMCSAEQALELGLVDEICFREEILQRGVAKARGFATRDSRAFQRTKHLMRMAVAERIRQTEEKSIDDFVDLWYSGATWKNLQQIRIRE